VALTALGQLPEACAALQQAVTLAPTQVKYQRNLAEITRFVCLASNFPSDQSLYPCVYRKLDSSTVLLARAITQTGWQAENLTMPFIILQTSPDQSFAH
jgi:hypothetical protein